MPRDEHWFEEVLQDTQSRLRAYIAAIGIPHHAVDDLAQEAYLVLYRNPERMPEDVEPIRWLKGVAFRLSLSYLRSSKRVAGREAVAVVQQLAEAAERTDENLAHAMQERLDLCLGQLSEKNRQLLEWRYAESRSSVEIARLLSTNENAIRIALMRIRNALRECMTAAQGG